MYSFLEARLFAIARRFWPGISEANGRERAVGLGDVYAILYAAPITVVAVVWLVVISDFRVLAEAWFPLSVFFVLVAAFRRVDFTSYVEIRPGLMGSFGGSLDDIVRWPAALLFGPTALWMFLFWRTVTLVRDWRRSDVINLRWSAVRDFVVDAGGDTAAGLLALALYSRLGGTHPPQALSFAALTPAVYATLVRFIVPVLVSAPMISFLARSPSFGFDEESRRTLRRFSVLSSSWPLTIAPFSVFAAGLYVEKGIVGFLFIAVGALLASGLAHKMGRATELSAERTRELRSLEEFSRAVVDKRPDEEEIPALLEEHVGNMFTLCTTDIRLFPQTTLLHTPDYSEPAEDVVWEWLQATGETFYSPAGRELPWGGTPRSSGLVVVPILQSDNGATIGGIVIRKRVAPESVTELLPAAQSLASQIASALHGAEVYRQTIEHLRIEDELAVAADMQASLMPTSAPDVPGWEFKAIIDSAREASGDFVDLIPLSEGRWGILVADVSGKGVAAALYMAMVRTLIRTYAYEHERNPEDVITAVNRRILSDTDDESFVTTFYGVLDPQTGELTYCNAGHNPPLVFRVLDGGAVEELESTGIPLGMMGDAVWEAERVALRPGDKLLAYTDGVTDAQNMAEEEFGDGRLVEVAKANAALPPVEMRTAVFDEIKEFMGDAPQLDDITLMIVARSGV